jgi:sugar-specific transcriptional regulator TrmB
MAAPRQKAKDKAPKKSGAPQKKRAPRTRVEDVSDGDIRDLVDLGLTLNEARAYVALVKGASVTAAELATRADIARPKVYEALQLLEEHGFCKSIATPRATLFRAVPPSEALPHWLAHRDEERLLLAEHDAATSGDLVARLPEPEEAEAAVDPFAFLEPVFGRARTGQAFADLMDRAETSIDNMTQPPFQQAKGRWNVAESEAMARGVAVRTLFTTASVEDPDRWLPLAQAGGEVRVTTSIPMKLIIRDGVEAMIALRDLETGRQGVGNVIIRHPDLVGALHLLFEEAWQKADELGPNGHS